MAYQPDHMWQLSPTPNQLPLTDSTLIAMDANIERLRAMAPTRHLAREIRELEARRDEVAGRMANLRAIHEAAPGMRELEDIYGEQAYYRARGAGGSGGEGVAQLGPPAIGMIKGYRWPKEVT